MIRKNTFFNKYPVDKKQNFTFDCESEVPALF